MQFESNGCPRSGTRFSWRRSEFGEGAAVTTRTALRKALGMALDLPRARTADLRELAPN